MDDTVERIDFFLARLGARSVVVAKTYEEAIAAFRSGTFSRAFLDHDLGGTRNGTDIAYFMARRLPRSRRPAVTVHSVNIAGALGMLLTLRKAGFAVETDPFPPRCLEEDDDG